MATVYIPWEAFDATHPDHEDWARSTGRCFATAEHDCPDPSEITFGCTLTVANDMEAMAVAYNRWYRKARPIPLAVDGGAYRRRVLARRRRNRRE